MWPVLQAIHALGGSGDNDEIDQKAAELGQFTEEQRAELHKGGPRTKLEYHFAWARSCLKLAGLVTSPRQRVWQVTDAATNITKAEVSERYASARKEQVLRKELGEAQVPESENVDEPGDIESEDWKSELLAELMAMEPAAFERLSERLLKKAGFINTQVSGRSGDGGIDGQGVYRVSLVSFPVYFQCKRYRDSVGSSVVRDFRGAMAGRGEKGLLITTGTFTTSAQSEATRDGAPPVDLIDGDRLCDLLKDYGLGVSTTIRQVEDITVDTEFLHRI
jgi:restriction system protein